MGVTTALVLGGIGAGLSFYGQQQQAKAARKAGEYNNQVSRNQAQEAEMAGMENARRKRTENRKKLARLKAGLAGAGVRQDTGSPLATIGETASSLELEAMDIHNNASRQSSGLYSQGAMAEYNGNQQATGMQIQSYGTLLSSASNLAGQGASIHRTKPTA